MKHITILIFLCTSMLFCSCHTALQLSQVQRNTHNMENANMEFIGFNNINKNNVMFKEFGADLERNQIAINKQNFYMGAYSLQELKNYKSSMRYITFVDVVRHTYSHSDAVHNNPDMEIAGWFIAGFTIFTLFPIYVPLICCADKNDCQIKLKGEYNLYIYDTEKKEIVYNSQIELNEDDIYQGQYSHKKTDKKAINERYKNILYNTLLEHYAQAYNYIASLPQ